MKIAGHQARTLALIKVLPVQKQQGIAQLGQKSWQVHPQSSDLEPHPVSHFFQ
jgi:hypothetical protein